MQSVLFLGWLGFCVGGGQLCGAEVCSNDGQALVRMTHSWLIPPLPYALLDNAAMMSAHRQSGRSGTGIRQVSNRSRGGVSDCVQV